MGLWTLDVAKGQENPRKFILKKGPGKKGRGKSNSKNKGQKGGASGGVGYVVTRGIGLKSAPTVDESIKFLGMRTTMDIKMIGVAHNHNNNNNSLDLLSK